MPITSAQRACIAQLLADGFRAQVVSVTNAGILARHKSGQTVLITPDGKVR